MMDAQMVFNRLSKLKQEQKELKAAYRDALTHDKNFQDCAEALKLAKDKKAQAEKHIKSDFGPEFDRLDELKQLINDDQMILSDLTFNSLVKGEKVEIYDEHETQYEPVLSVRFKKTNKQRDDAK